MAQPSKPAMNQELLLFGPVPLAHQSTLLAQLRGLARMPPQPVTEWHLIFSPRTPSASSPPNPPKPSSLQPQEAQTVRALLAQPLHYLQLVGTPSPSPSSSEKSREGETTWSLVFTDTPEPARSSPVTTRNISRTPLTPFPSSTSTSSPPLALLTSLGYTLSAQYILRGWRVYDKAATLFLYTIYTVFGQLADIEEKYTGMPAEGQWMWLDAGGAGVLQVSVEVAAEGGVGIGAGTGAGGGGAGAGGLKEAATAQLLALRDVLRPSVGLGPGERGALDTRVMGSVRRG